jgi:hypothetical protein
MNETLLALGRGVVKVLVSLFVGTGVGLVTFGAAIRDAGDVWRYSSSPPPGLFLAVGTGMLVTGVTMGLMFFVPRLCKKPAPTKPAPVHEWSS